MKKKVKKQEVSVREYTNEEMKWCNEVHNTIAKVIPHNLLEGKRISTGVYYGINVWLRRSNRRKGICRLYLEGKVKKLVILDNKCEKLRLPLNSTCGICKQYKEEITKYTKLIKKARGI